MEPRSQSAIRNVQFEAGWLLVGLLVVALLLRFGMRALGVRADLPIPGLVYSATAPIVEPFYRFLPASPRFDTSVVEVASPAAAGTVFAVAVAVYVFCLLAISLFHRRGAENAESR
jgi:hypothetical protein